MPASCGSSGGVDAGIECRRATRGVGRGSGLIAVKKWTPGYGHSVERQTVLPARVARPQISSPSPVKGGWLLRVVKWRVYRTQLTSWIGFR